MTSPVTVPAPIGPSLIRTYVPAVIGAALSWLVTLGIEVDNDTRTLIVTGLTAILTSAYYTGARLLERKFPWATVLLGSSVQPVAYQPAIDDPPGRHEAPETPPTS